MKKAGEAQTEPGGKEKQGEEEEERRRAEDERRPAAKVRSQQRMEGKRGIR